MFCCWVNQLFDIHVSTNSLNGRPRFTVLVFAHMCSMKQISCLLCRKRSQSGFNPPRCRRQRSGALASLRIAITAYPLSDGCNCSRMECWETASRTCSRSSGVSLYLFHSRWNRSKKYFAALGPCSGSAPPVRRARSCMRLSAAWYRQGITSRPVRSATPHLPSRAASVVSRRKFHRLS